MVYCGKPSKGCAQCRARRTKCDTKWPGCGQCSRAGRSCSGYRDPLTLMFRNQTEELTMKHGGRSEQNSPKPEPVKLNVIGTLDSRRTPISHSHQVSDFPDLGCRELSTPVEEQATNFFIQNYILDDFKGHYSYQPSVYNTLPAGSALSEAITSLGMAGIADARRDTRLMIKANFKYTSALRSVSAALRDPEEAKTDQTLVAVMLLGLFETNTCSTPRSMSAWARHIQGASSLVQLRGKQQLQHRVGYELFIQLRSQVILNCLQRHIAVPKAFRDWSTDAIQYESEEEAAATVLYNIIAEYCDFRATMKCFNDYSRSVEIVSAALEMNVKLATWASSLPQQYAYDIISISELSEEIYTDHYHVYRNLWIAAVWNNYRCVRVLVNELLLVHLLYLSQRQRSFHDEQGSLFSYDSDVARAKSLMMTLTHEICATVPFYLGHHKSQQSPPKQPKAVNGNLVIWPLYIVASMDVISDMMQAWAVKRLEKIGESMGVRQATALANVLSRGKTITLWEAKDELEPQDW